MAGTKRRRWRNDVGKRGLVLEALGDRIVPVFGLPHGASLVPAGTAAGSAASYVSPRTISDDGRYQVFTSLASDLTNIPDANGGEDIFVRDLWTGATKLASVNWMGTAAAAGGSQGNSYAPSISGNGRYVVFWSGSQDLVGFPAYRLQIYRRDLLLDVTQMVSVDGSGATGNQDAYADPTISADGRYVAFCSNATNLVTGIADAPLSLDAFVRDMATGTTRMVSVSPDGLSAGNGTSSFAQISADGTKVTFVTNADNLATGVRDNNAQADLYQRDLATNTTVIVSRGYSGAGTGDHRSNFGKQPTSTDGRYVAFNSLASTLLHNLSDVNNTDDVFVRDLVAGTTTMVSVNSSGAGAGSFSSFAPAISGNGRYVAFVSQASDLVAGFGGGQQIYRRDLQTGVTEAVSVNSAGTGGGNFASNQPTISADGRFICFESEATNLVAGVTDIAGNDVFVRDMQTGTTVYASIAPGGTSTGVGFSTQASISSDGSAVVFLYNFTDLVASLPDNNGSRYDVFAWKRATNAVELVSINSAGSGSGDFDSSSPVISANGRYISFTSGSTDLTATSQTNAQIYRRDLQTGTTALVSMNQAGTTGGNAGSRTSSLSADGRYVAFSSNAWDLIPNDINTSGSDVFVRDMIAGTTDWISRNSAGTGTPNSHSAYDTTPQISADGSIVVFETYATNLVAGISDSNGALDVFAFDRNTSATTMLSLNATGTAAGTDFSSSAFISADGSRAVFISAASDLVAGCPKLAGASEWNVFARNLPGGATEVVSQRAAGVFAASGAAFSVFSQTPDGTRVAFTDGGVDILPGAFRGFGQVYVRDLTTGQVWRASSTTAGAAGFYFSGYAKISDDGARVVFESDNDFGLGATNNNRGDIFAKDLSTGVLTLVSINSTGTDFCNLGAGSPSMSADGVWVAFHSESTNLTVDVDANNANDVFVRNLTTQTTYLVSRGSSGQSNDQSTGAQIARDGSVVGFQSFASNLLAGVVDTNGQRDVFASFRDALTVLSVGPVTPDPRNTTVASVQFTLNRRAQLGSLDFTDLALTRDGGSNLLTNVVAIAYLGGTTYQINNLTGFTGQQGVYSLTVNAAGMLDDAGNPGNGAAADTWTMDATRPAIVVLGPVVPDPRNSTVSFVDVQFSEPIDLGSFDSGDLSLRRNLGSNLIDFTSGVTVTLVSGSTYRIGNLDGLTALEGNYLLQVNVMGILDLAGNAGDSATSDAWKMDLTGPKIANVYFDGTNWSAAFRAAAGSAAFGFPAQTGANQLKSLPWSTVDIVRIRFDEAAVVDVADLSIRGINVANYAIAGFSYDAVNFVATWTLAAAIDTDRILLDLDGAGIAGVADLAGNQLAGNWIEGASVFPTTGPAGVDFQFRFVVGVGDADRNGLIRNADLNLVRNNLFVDAGQGGYNVFADIDGNGQVRNVDLNQVRNHLFVDPPAGPGPNRPHGRGAERRSASGPRNAARPSGVPLQAAVGSADAAEPAPHLRRLHQPTAAELLDCWFANGN